MDRLCVYGFHLPSNVQTLQNQDRFRFAEKSPDMV